MLYDTYEQFTHGYKCFQTIAGVRHLVALRPTIRPYPAELEHAFETRMARLGEILHTDPKMKSIKSSFKYADNRIVECEFDIELVPEPQPILDLGTVTSPRATARGTRGSDRMREVARA